MKMDFYSISIFYNHVLCRSLRGLFQNGSNIQQVGPLASHRQAVMPMVADVKGEFGGQSEQLPY